MSTKILGTMLVSATLLASAALADKEPPPPGWGVRGADEVALVRLYEKAGGATTALGRAGLVLGKAGATTAFTVAEAQSGLGAFSVRVSARRKDDGAEISWEVMPGASRLPPSRGSKVVKMGTLGHVVLQRAGDHELFASVDVGRASSYLYQQLASYFQGPVGAPAMPAPSWPPPAPPPAIAPGWVAGTPVAAPPARVGELPAGVLVLRLRVERDGEVLTAPVVKVRNGEEFEVTSKRRVELAAGQPFEGIELRGTPRFDGRTTWLDLSVQSGRALEGAGPATYLVDRYRQGVEAPLGQEVVVSLFDDLEGASAGRLRLFVTVTRE